MPSFNNSLQKVSTNYIFHEALAMTSFMVMCKPQNASTKNEHHEKFKCNLKYLHECLSTMHNP